MSARSKKRRHALRRRRRETFALIERTGVAYVSPDVHERLVARSGMADAQPLMPGIELVVVERFAPGTIAGFDFDRFAPMAPLRVALGPVPAARDFGLDLGRWGRR